jgi:hypothetical protein
MNPLPPISVCPVCLKRDVNVGHYLSHASSEAKAAHSRLAGAAPVKPGNKPRGWPKGRPRKVQVQPETRVQTMPQL